MVEQRTVCIWKRRRNREKLSGLSETFLIIIENAAGLLLTSFAGKKLILNMLAVSFSGVGTIHQF